jgi:hypothetical protein
MVALVYNKDHEISKFVVVKVINYSASFIVAIVVIIQPKIIIYTPVLEAR